MSAAMRGWITWGLWRALDMSTADAWPFAVFAAAAVFAADELPVELGGSSKLSASLSRAAALKAMLISDVGLGWLAA